MPTPSSSAASLFAGWPETMILSCLQGHMGTLSANHDNTAAAVTVGDFCFLSGTSASRTAPRADFGAGGV